MDVLKQKIYELMMACEAVGQDRTLVNQGNFYKGYLDKSEAKKVELYNDLIRTLKETL